MAKCPACLGLYANCLDHTAFTALQLQPLGLLPCPDCGTACRSDHGIRTHRQKAHGIEGLSRSSTRPRAHSAEFNYSDPLPTASSFQPSSPPVSGALRGSRWADSGSRRPIRRPTSPLGPILRKRGARTPSPGAQPPTQRLNWALETSPSLGASPGLASSRASTPDFPALEDILDSAVPEPTVAMRPPQRRNRLARPTTVPPEPCNEAKTHAEVVAPILEEPAVQRLLKYSNIPVPETRLHARHAATLATTANRLAEAFIQRPRTAQLLDLLLLPRLLGLGIAEGKLGAMFRAYPALLPPPPTTTTTNRPPGRTRAPEATTRAIQLLEKGYIGRASRALVDSSALAPETPDTLEELRAKHPLGVKNPFSGRSSPRPGQSIPLSAIKTAIDSMGREKAPGLSGWTKPLLEACMAPRANNTTTPAILEALRLLADMIRQGTAPGKSLLTASRLVSLEKEGGGIRPIAVGELFYRVAIKAILITNSRPGMLLPCQLGVGSPGGTEPLLFRLEEAIMGGNTAGIQSIGSVDLVNAFNSISRMAVASSVARWAPQHYRMAAWAYNEPSILVTPGGTTLASTTGLRQGDPAGPLFFSLAFRPTMEALQARLPHAEFMAYLDDLYILSSRTMDVVDLTEDGSRQSSSDQTNQPTNQLTSQPTSQLTS